MKRVPFISGSFGAMFLMLSAGACATKNPALPQPPQASIPFARDEISNWVVTNDHTVYIESIDNKWYRADLMGTCIDLPFADRIGFSFNADGSFDQFGSIVSKGQNCPLQSLTTSKPPRGYKHKHALGPKEAQDAPSSGNSKSSTN